MAVFKKRGACVLIPVDVLAMGGWSVSFFFLLSFFLAFDWKLVSLFFVAWVAFFIFRRVGTAGDRDWIAKVR